MVNQKEIDKLRHSDTLWRYMYLSKWIFKIVYEDDKVTRYKMAQELLDTIREFDLIHQNDLNDKELKREKRRRERELSY